MNKWLDTLVEEKKLDIEHTFEVDGPSGWNFIPLGVVIEHIKLAPQYEKQEIKKMLVALDFLNGDVMHYFGHLAKAIAA